MAVGHGRITKNQCLRQRAMRKRSALRTMLHVLGRPGVASRVESLRLCLVEGCRFTGACVWVSRVQTEP
jgi:hypothetical protein